MCLLYEFLVALNNLLCPHLGVAIGSAKVVDTLKHDDGLHSVLCQTVAVESLHCGVAQPSEAHGISSNAQVEHSYVLRSLIGLQSIGEKVSPSVLQVGRCSASIGNRVSNHSDSFASLPSHIDGSDIIPMILSLGVLCEVRLWRGLTVYNIRGSARSSVTCSVHRSLAIADVDTQSLQRFEVVSQLIAHHSPASGNRNILLSIKLQVFCSFGIDFYSNVRHVSCSHWITPRVVV